MSCDMSSHAPRHRTPLGMTKRVSLESIASEVRACTRCPLHMHRILAVPGEGPESVRVVVVGEAPGRDEDASGRPFVGSAGRILTSALASADLHREDVFITNVVKCRPPNNRVPTRTEVETCTGRYLEAQIRLLRPKVILLLGKTAIRAVTGLTAFPPGHLIRSQGVNYVCTYHPAALLYNRKLKTTLESDIGLISELLERHGSPGNARGDHPSGPGRGTPKRRVS